MISNTNLILKCYTLVYKSNLQDQERESAKCPQIRDTLAETYRVFAFVAHIHHFEYRVNSAKYTL